MSNFSFSAAINNLVGNTAGANVSNLVQCLNDLRTFLNARNLDATNIADIPESLLALALQQKLGLNDGGQIGRGATIIAGSESRTNTSYGTHTTPDQVANVVLPTNGYLRIVYKAQWQESVANAGRAAIFIGSNQLKIPVAGSTPAVQEASTGTGTANIDHPLFTWCAGLTTPSGNTTDTGDDVTTGMAVAMSGSSVGGYCIVEAAAGTYTVSVQTKSSSGSVTLKNRKLWVEAVGF